MFILSTAVYEQKDRNNIQVLLIFDNQNLSLRVTSCKYALPQTSKLSALRYRVVGYLNICGTTCTSFRLILIAFQIKSVPMKRVTVV